VPISPARDGFCPGELWPDNLGIPINAHGAGILAHGGAYYWFGEHKIAGEAGNLAQVGVHCYSSTDLYNWHDEGIALSVAHDPARDIARGCIIERPKVVYCPATGKFVMWFHLELKDQGYKAARVGTAVADTPVGPYHFVASFRPNAGHWPSNADGQLTKPLSAEEAARLAGMEFSGGMGASFPGDLLLRRDFAGGQMSRDMTLFVDDDGSAYHIAAAEENGTLHLSQLTDDFLQTSGKFVRLFPGGFNEAPAICKRRGKYYLITSGCTGWNPNAARAAVADSIWGPWTELGNPCVGPEAETTFGGQGTYILPAPGAADAFIFLADRWRPEDAIEGRYVWLPLEFDGERPRIEWLNTWDLDYFADH
jgi:hypothetical protein